MRTMIRPTRRSDRGSRGQAMVELALVFPLFVMVFFGIIVLGIGLFYQQQVTNAAREAARFAAIHSATSSKPTVSWKDPAAQPLTYNRYDRPEESWPYMTAAGRRLIFGINKNDVNVAACWSGYWQDSDPAKFDAPPPLDPPGYDVIGPVDSTFAQCTIDGADPTSDPEDIGCTNALAATTNDTASNLSEGQGRIVANTVSAYACYRWSPPLAGFLLIPQTVTLRAVITEPIQRQQ
jgi:hypothetical protein